jgi:hypothetical protein
MLRESSISPVSEAALTIQELLCRYPTHFVSAEALALLNGKEVSTNQYTPCYPSLTQFLLVNWQPCGRIRMLPEVVTIRSIQMSSYHSALEYVTCWHLYPKTKGFNPFRRWCHLLWESRAHVFSSKSQPVTAYSVLSQIADEIRILLQCNNIHQSYVIRRESMESG